LVKITSLILIFDNLRFSPKTGRSFSWETFSLTLGIVNGLLSADDRYFEAKNIEGNYRKCFVKGTGNI